MNQSLHYITDDLLVKYLLEETTPEESKMVTQWLNEDAAHKKYFDQLAAVWDKSKFLAATSTVNEDEAWERFTQRLPKKQAAVRSIFSTKKLSRIAAILIVVLSGSLLAYQFFNSNRTDFKQLTIATSMGIETDTLPDASVITLNKNSSLSYPSAFTGNERKVLLNGEAFFKISPNKKKPFIITVNDVTVRVVGTSFNIKSINGITEVIVETGIVKVIKDNKIVELYPGEKITVQQNASSFTKEASTDHLYNYYRSKVFECDNTPLWKVVEVLNEAYGVNIVIENKALQNMSLTTTFNNDSLDNILNIIQQTFNITISKKGKQIILQ